MEPRISVRRKGDEVFLTVEGDFNHESSRELLSVARQLLQTSLKCAAPGSRVIFSLKTRSKVDHEKLAQFQQTAKNQPGGQGSGEETRERPEPKVESLQKETSNRPHRNGLVLVKGGPV